VDQISRVMNFLQNRVSLSLLCGTHMQFFNQSVPCSSWR
jgi:hypothetical protein